MFKIKDYIEREPYDATQFDVGDILDASFQYTAKIPHFYKVVRRTPSMIECVKLKQKNVTDDGYGQNGTCVPIENEIVNDKKYKGRISRGRVKIDGCIAKLWDGEPVDFYTD